MKTITIFTALVGMLLVSGCSSPRGGTADDFETTRDPMIDQVPAPNDNGWSPRPDRTTGPVIPPP